MRADRDGAPSLSTIMQRIGRDAVWAPLSVVLLHSIFGSIVGHEPYVDPTSHFLGGTAVAFFFWRSSFHARRRLGDPNALALDLIAFGLATVAALAWELGEFASDVFRGTHFQRDVANTMGDLMLGAAGAGAYLVVRRALHRWRPLRRKA